MKLTGVMYLRLSLFHCYILYYGISQKSLPRNTAKPHGRVHWKLPASQCCHFQSNPDTLHSEISRATGNPPESVGEPPALLLGQQKQKADWKPRWGRADTSGKMAPPTCREFPFSVLPCPIVIFLRNRSLVSNTEREQVGLCYSINKYGVTKLEDAEEGAENKSQSLASSELSIEGKNAFQW